MKYLRQVFWILLFSFLGELLHGCIGLPVPASVYGMVLLFLALTLRIIRLEQVKESGSFLVNIMAVLFVCPAVGLMKYWQLLRENLVGFCVIVFGTLVLVFWVSGAVTQKLLEKEGKQND